ncbi:MAG: hypothetical protein A3D65_04000 [Candidatus Lloydbacteria bacterium RIFCSPHIGHO2_02_FULL_50_13]|uniref:Signal peptidase I n=1 Tax=Candidatus Lloydbacteria bacterium RIFCSPHIGHO2_02_FULL_50_13 TaxID=1798661 RepID=A0A1G2DBC6_9BACT|nr:MAG: hypothetical protein A3D65_04000 [Candidatus Lloydbacteria bacterium RIFCSPHIGHO2_02_FULL_50_13]
MKEILSKHLKSSGVVLITLIVVAGFIYVQNKPKTEKAEKTLNAENAGGQPPRIESDSITLQVDGYDFAIGDIVQIKTNRPVFGDVIIYDPFKNESMCLSMGPDMSLGKIIGVPGETFSFQDSSLKIRTETVEFGRNYAEQKAAFRSQKYENLVGKDITLQTGEYLIDQWAGLECFPGELNDAGSVPYNRFTVIEEAIIGVIEKKVGHDEQAEREFKDRAY